jgi:flagellar secretion chaperone FliS
MFAPALSQRNTASSFAGTYHQVGVETGVSSASPHQLVTMLYDGFNDAVIQAMNAMRLGEIEAKGKAIGKAARIVEEGLLSALDLDGGGRLADDLMALYSYVTRRLTHANLRNDPAALDECLRLMAPVRSAWIAIGPGAPAAAKGQ